MRDETLVEMFAAPEIFVDGFSDHQVHNGVMTCAGYRIQTTPRQNGEPIKVVVVRLVFPLCALEPAIADAKHAQGATLSIVSDRRDGRH
jgi:hypothetical protein